MKIIIKYNFIDSNNVEVIYIDKSSEIISIDKFNKFNKEGLVKMAFIK